jgi:hypothetical protein
LADDRLAVDHRLARVEAANRDPLKARAVAEFDKAMTVAKLRGARERKKSATGAKVEGRKSLVETRPEVVALARELRRKRRGSRMAIAAELAARGHVAASGRAFSSSVIACMTAGKAAHGLRAAKQLQLPGPIGRPGASLRLWQAFAETSRRQGRGSRRPCVRELRRFPRRATADDILLRLELPESRTSRQCMDRGLEGGRAQS